MTSVRYVSFCKRIVEWSKRLETNGMLNWRHTVSPIYTSCMQRTAGLSLLTQTLGRSYPRLTYHECAMFPN